MLEYKQILIMKAMNKPSLLVGIYAAEAVTQEQEGDHEGQVYRDKQEGEECREVNGSDASLMCIRKKR